MSTSSYFHQPSPLGFVSERESHSQASSSVSGYHSRFQYQAQPSSYHHQSQQQRDSSTASYFSNSAGQSPSFASPSAHYGTSAWSSSTPVASPGSNNIDDIVYRYSAEFDRAPGTPTVGIYAQDGLWDEEEEDRKSRISDANTARPSSSATSRKGSIATVPSVKGRSRAGTMSAATAAAAAVVGLGIEDSGKAGWAWNKKAGVEVSPTMPTDDGSKKGLKKQKSKGFLKGKGRRGELNVVVPPEADESFEAPPPMPATPASFLTESSPASFTSPFLSPINYPSPAFDSTPVSATAQTIPNTSASSNSQPSVASSSKPVKPTSSWKRGVQKIFKSKSHAALREAAQKENVPPPPLPLHNLPGPSRHPLGKPFSSSTPPLGTRRPDVATFGLQSPALSLASQSFASPSHNRYNLPPDPFASSLDLKSNNPAPPTLASPPPLRPSLRGNSPSLRDLKNFLQPSHKPKLSKAKSLANLQHTSPLNGPKSAPLEQTEVFPPAPTKTSRMANRMANRMSSVIGLNGIVPDAAHSELEFPPAHGSLSPPMESPPLLPPHPPYFAAAKRSSSVPSITTDSSPDDNASATHTPPDAPLPPVPNSASSSSLSAPITRSGSGAVLLPRSRSTSMSLKSPPTSSSFFDLYEQLGIWPTGDKEKEKEASREKEQHKEEKENAPPAEQSIPEEPVAEAMALQPESSLPPSSSINSSASWDIALNTFPDAPVNESLDFGLPYVAEAEGIESMIEESNPTADMSDELSMIAVATSSRSSTHRTALNASTSTSQTNNDNRTSTSTQPTSISMSFLNSFSSSTHRRRSGSESGGSSRGENPLRKRDIHGDKEELTDEEEQSTDEEDDVPLSKLHPEAAAAQAQRKQERRARRTQKEAERLKIKERERQLQLQRNDSVKTQGRNPGGEIAWNGEGGVPADVLRRKLERVVLLRAQREAALQAGPSSPRTAAQFMQQQQQQQQQQQALKAHQTTNHYHTTSAVQDQGVQRAHSHGHTAVLPLSTSSTWKHRNVPPLPPIQTKSLQRGPISPTDMTFGRLPSGGQRIDPAFATAMQGNTAPLQVHAYADRSRQNSAATTISSIGGQGGPTRPPHPTRAPSRQDDQSANVTRSNTGATQHSVASAPRQRSRAMSNAAPPISQAHESAALHSRAITEPLPPPPPPKPVTIVHAPAFVSALDGKKIVLDLQPHTTARDILVQTYHNGDLVDASVGMSWVLCEIFAEIGCERQVREYEQLAPIVKGWDQTAKFNCFMFKQTNRGVSTWARAVPNTPPMLGSWVQYETKKGKWSKRWLETRGGQVFLAKNEKNKDEVQINTLFFDVYEMKRGYDAPKPHVFIMRRLEAAATFENPQDYMHVFSCEDGLAWKLMSAIYDAKSYTLSTTYPNLIAAHLPPPPPTPTTATGITSPLSSLNTRRPNFAQSGGIPPPPTAPLVSLKREEGERSAFTGKGLLKI
ncbi:hypothetical protein CI109_106498 [Kwoniella shandongensis]|uniref:Uncharacterized protein n=1 Tax=Kwoniella shandongensis TaxID=1734106 RepID=A0A5M6C1Q0_9TREE|nr:uncharacterized protein CI109_002680 [Kwoniella shandongensis]KAA5528923.1 hypothetical protein CI109_002680 [Kwoniella shandongensis]